MINCGAIRFQVIQHCFPHSKAKRIFTERAKARRSRGRGHRNGLVAQKLLGGR
jgi:hypothetical protein